MMEEIKIILPKTEAVMEFVRAAEQCDFDIDIYYDRVIIDAKSFLGILSMDLTKVLTVSCREYDESFLSAIQKYQVA